MFNLTISNITDAAKAGANEGSSALANASPTARSLLSTNGTNITLVNPVPDLQWEASIEDSYFLDGNEIFSGEVATIGVKLFNGNSLPNWLSFEPKAIGSLEMPDIVRGLALQSDIAFAAVQDSGLQLVDISNPFTPLIISSVDTPGLAYDVAVQGNFAFVADRNSGLQVIDVSNVTAPLTLSSISTPGSARGLILHDTLVFVADDNSGLQVIDVSNPAAPSIIGSVDTSGIAYKVVLQNNLIFLADGTSGLQVIDVNTPSSPIIIGTLDLPGVSSGIAIEGDLVYLASATSGLHIINVTNPNSPTLHSSLATSGEISDVSVQNNLAFLSDQFSGFEHIVDITNTSAPIIVGSIDSLCSVKSAALQESLAVVATSCGLELFNLGEGSLRGLSTEALVGQEYELYLLAYSSEGFFQILDPFTLTVNQLPKRQITSLSDYSLFPNEVLELGLRSNELFTDPDGRLLAVSMELISGQLLPAWLNYELQPTLLNTVELPAQPRDVAMEGNLAVVAQGVGLQLVDISESTSPIIVGSVPTPGTASSVALEGNFAYVADRDSGLQVVDISDASSPSIVANVPTPGSAYGVAIKDNLAFVADGDSGLQVVDVSNPISPAIINAFSTPGFSYDVALQYNLAVVADDTSLQLVDVSDLSAMTSLSSYQSAGSITAVTLQGSFAVFADSFDGIQVLDISNTAAPTLLGNLEGLTSFTAVTTQGSSVITASEIEYYLFGLSFFDLTTWQFTANPTEADVGNYEIVVTATDTLGGSVSDSFELRVEGPPRFNRTLFNQTLAVGEAFNYFLPQGTVSDPNNDLIAFEAALVDGSSLPAWLGFNGFAATFAGTPDTDGVFEIRLSATDNIAGSDSAVFTLTVDFKPQINDPIVAPSAWREGRASTYTIPSNAFVSLNGHVLNYSASLEDEAPLPNWLTFASSNNQFSGLPPLGSANNFVVLVKATDVDTLFDVSQPFVLTVSPNFPPEIVNPMPPQSAAAGVEFEFVVPDDVFVDRNGDTLLYFAGNKPDWLSFSSDTRTFSGTPGRDDSRAYRNAIESVEVIASDGELNATATYQLSVSGQTTGEFLSRVGLFSLTALASVSTGACLLVCFYNACCDKRYRRLEEPTIAAGLDSVGTALELSCDPESVVDYQLFVTRKPGTGCCCGLFCCCESKSKPYPTKLPYWLKYRGHLNAFVIVKPPRAEDLDGKEMTLEVYGRLGYILETLHLHGAGDESAQDTFDDTDAIDTEGGVAMHAMS